VTVVCVVTATSHPSLGRTTSTSIATTAKPLFFRNSGRRPGFRWCWNSCGAGVRFWSRSSRRCRSALPFRSDRSLYRQLVRRAGAGHDHPRQPARPDLNAARSLLAPQPVFRDSRILGKVDTVSRRNCRKQGLGARCPSVRTMDRPRLHPRRPEKCPPGTLHTRPRRQPLQSRPQGYQPAAQSDRQTSKSCHHRHHAQTRRPRQRPAQQQRKMATTSALTNTDTLAPKPSIEPRSNASPSAAIRQSAAASRYDLFAPFPTPMVFDIGYPFAVHSPPSISIDARPPFRIE
jgi:hypothetical protein